MKQTGSGELKPLKKEDYLEGRAWKVHFFGDWTEKKTLCYLEHFVLKLRESNYFI